VPSIYMFVAKVHVPDSENDLDSERVLGEPAEAVF
jgi:hypothetical protein